MGYLVGNMKKPLGFCDGNCSLLECYIRDVGSFQLIQASDEIALAKLIKKGISAQKELLKLCSAPNKKTAKGAQKQIAGNRVSTLEKSVKDGVQAREKMIKSNLRLVIKLAQEYASYGFPLIDMISEGNIGLTKAVDRFKPDKGAKLSTYASWWIRQSIRRLISSQSKAIRLPVHMTDKIAKLRRLTTQLKEEFGREPSDEELAEEMKVSCSKIALLRAAGLSPTSLNAPVGDSDGMELGEIICDESANQPDEWVERKELTQKMMLLLEQLDERERMILTLRYGLNGKKAMTLEEVGSKFNVTRERIRQLQETSLQKLNIAMDSALTN